MSGQHPGYKMAGGGWPAVTSGSVCFVGVMALSYGLFICLLLWGGTELCCSEPFWQGGTPRVVVKCLEAQLVVTVSKDLFGTRKLIRTADLTLGPEHCEPLVSMDTDDVVRFEVGLHDCGNSLQVRLGPPRWPRLWWEDMGEAARNGKCGFRLETRAAPFHLWEEEQLRPGAGHW